MVLDSSQAPIPVPKDTYESLDKTLNAQQDVPPAPPAHQVSPSSHLKRHHSLPHHQPRSVDNLMMAARGQGPISSRTRRAQAAQGGMPHYDAPDEEDELLDEVLTSTKRAMKHLEKDPKQLRQSASNLVLPSPYPTPSPSANGHAVLFGDGAPEAITPKPLNLNQKTNEYKWPTPPYDENDWAASASASIWAAGNRF